MKKSILFLFMVLISVMVSAQNDKKTTVAKAQTVHCTNCKKDCKKAECKNACKTDCKKAECKDAAGKDCKKAECKNAANKGCKDCNKVNKNCKDCKKKK